MSRPLRIKLLGAIYHVTSRGDRREPLFVDDDSRRALLAVVAQRQGFDSWWRTDFALRACSSITPPLRERPLRIRSAARRNRSWRRREACISALSVNSSSVKRRQQGTSMVGRYRSMRAVIERRSIWPWAE